MFLYISDLSSSAQSGRLLVMPLVTVPFFSLQCTHQIIKTLHKVIPLDPRGMTLRNRLTINCVRCSGNVRERKRVAAK